MSIKYDKMFTLLREAGYNATAIRREAIIGQGTLTKIKQGRGGLEHRTIDKLCKILNCQPGDLMEYVPDPPESDEQRASKIAEQQGK